MKLMGTTMNEDGIITKTYYDPSTETFTDRMSTDLTDLMERNKYERNNSNNGFTKEGDMRKIAELDMLTVYRLKSEFNIDVFNNDDMPRLKRWLKDNRGFTTVNGGF
jgi:hypothetical protein